MRCENLRLMLGDHKIKYGECPEFSSLRIPLNSYCLILVKNHRIDLTAQMPEYLFWSNADATSTADKISLFGFC